MREQVEALVDAGYREITLTGVDIGHYGRDLTPRTSLAALIARLAEVPDLRWLRLSSVLPAYWSDELIEAVTGTPAVVPHLHLPLQSGSDRVLQLMRRPYNLRMFRALVERLAGAIPDLGLGTDLIVGHPGEEDDDFAATLRVVEELPLSYLHVFPYSDRKGTEAAGRGGHVTPPVIRERSARVRTLGRAKNLAFRRALVGRRRAGARAPGAGSRDGVSHRAHLELRRGALRRPGGPGAALRPGPDHRRGHGSNLRGAGGGGRVKGKAAGGNDGQAAVGVIGGSGLYEMDGLEDIRWVKVKTPFGEPSDAYCVGRLGQKTVIFLARHGRGHRVTPSDINYRANIYGLKSLGVTAIISVSAVGSMKEDIHPWTS